MTDSQPEINLQPLLEPITIRKLAIRNRMVSTAHNSRYGEGGLPTDRYQRYSEEKARGGIGLVVFGGGASVAPESKGSSYQLSIYDERIVPLLKQFSARIHDHGAALMCQLAHMGRKTKWSTADWLPPMGPSFVRERNHRSFPKILEEHDIWRIVEAFARCAEHCREGGLDGIEVAAHAQQLVDQFLSPHSNQRTDQWGGSLENRMRFAREVLKAIRRRCGEDFVIGLRLVGDERLEGGLTAEECGTIARLLSEEGLVDFLNVTSGQLFNHMNRARYSPGMWSAMGPYLSVAQAIKQHVSVPVMHAARIHDVRVAARALADGLVDMVGLTRAYIADPHLGRNIYEGRVAEIRPASVPTTASIGYISAARPCASTTPPRAGRMRSRTWWCRRGRRSAWWWWGAARPGSKRRASARSGGTRSSSLRRTTSSAARSPSLPRRPGEAN